MIIHDGDKTYVIPIDEAHAEVLWLSSDEKMKLPKEEAFSGPQSSPSSGSISQLLCSP